MEDPHRCASVQEPSQGISELEATNTEQTAPEAVFLTQSKIFQK